MRGARLAVVAVPILLGAGCNSLLGIEPLTLSPDARTDVPTAPIDGDPALCVGSGLLRVCPRAEPTEVLTLDSALELSTKEDAECHQLVMSGSVEVCVRLYAAITIGGGGAIQATGPRPLALVSWSTISGKGTIEVASVRGKRAGAGSNPAECVPAGAPMALQGGSGGSFQGRGGLGGNNGPPPSAPVGAVDHVRGGCPGGRGEVVGGGGDGGGAVYLIARDRVTIDGRINASGGGGTGTMQGTAGGGGGGGAGGLIGIEAPILDGGGVIYANGGGGGGGGNSLVPGSNGGESGGPTQGGAGGTGAANGGSGSQGAVLAGRNAENGSSPSGGGGGGGGAGMIYLRVPTVDFSGTVAPLPTIGSP